MNTTNIKLEEVYSFKLTSGEELIAKVLSVADEELVIQSPVSVAPGPNGIGLMQSMFTSNPEAETRLNTNTVTVYAEADESVKTKYIQATTGLVVPDKKVLMG